MNNGGARRDRTDDLLRARQALSQLSYGPILGCLAYLLFLLSYIYIKSKEQNVFLFRLDFCRGEACKYTWVFANIQAGQKVVGLGGFEPPTSPLSGVRSNQLSYRPIFLLRYFPLLRVAFRCSLSHVLTYAPSLSTSCALTNEKSLRKKPLIDPSLDHRSFMNAVY